MCSFCSRIAHLLPLVVCLWLTSDECVMQIWLKGFSLVFGKKNVSHIIDYNGSTENWWKHGFMEKGLWEVTKEVQINRSDQMLSEDRCQLKKVIKVVG